MTLSSNDAGECMEVGFRFEKTYEDNDLLQLRVSAWNGFFGGAADIYVGIGRLKEVANLLRGFPSYVKDGPGIHFGRIHSRVCRRRD